MIKAFPVNWINPEAVMLAVAHVSGIPRDFLVGRSRVQHVTLARKIMAHLLYTRSHMSYQSIGHVLDKRDHSTIIYMNRTAAKMPSMLMEVHVRKAEEIHQQMLKLPLNDGTSLQVVEDV